jgi:hypothetical protein
MDEKIVRALIEEWKASAVRGMDLAEAEEFFEETARERVRCMAETKLALAAELEALLPTR